jgi:hypothetical protein
LVRQLITRWRIGRYESERRKDAVANRNASEHLDRLEEGIKDVRPGGGGVL